MGPNGPIPVVKGLRKQELPEAPGLAATLAGFYITYAGGWSLWRLFSFNLSYSDLFLNFKTNERLKSSDFAAICGIVFQKF